MKPASAGCLVKSRELLRTLGLLPEDEGVTEDNAATAPADAEVDFDGGPREPAPSTHPIEDHNAIVGAVATGGSLDAMASVTAYSDSPAGFEGLRTATEETPQMGCPARAVARPCVSWSPDE